MVTPLVEALLLRTLRRRDAAAPTTHPTRLVGRRLDVSSIGFVADRTSVLLQRPGGKVEVLPAGSLVLPSLLGRAAASYAVVTHEPVDVWLRIGPFDTADDRTVEQVELRLTVSLSDSASGLTELVDAADGDLDAVGEVLLERLAREVSARTTEAVHRRTLSELTGLSVGVLLDRTLPSTFSAQLVTRTDLEVLDVDWPTEGRGWPRPPALQDEAAPEAAGRRALPR